MMDRRKIGMKKIDVIITHERLIEINEIIHRPEIFPRLFTKFCGPLAVPDLDCMLLRTL
jgi:hypothetical protein